MVPQRALGAYAREKHDTIAKAEKQLAAQYWRLGLALSIAREKFKHGKWGQHLQSLGIDKTTGLEGTGDLQGDPYRRRGFEPVGRRGLCPPQAEEAETAQDRPHRHERQG